MLKTLSHWEEYLPNREKLCLCSHIGECTLFINIQYYPMLMVSRHYCLIQPQQFIHF